MGLSSSALWIVVAVVVLGGIIKAAFSKPSRILASRFKRIDLFNSTEHAFLLALRREAPPHIVVLAKVRVGDLLTPIGQNHAANNRIQRKHVDFVLYHAQSRRVLMAIELDGPTHTTKRAQDSDKIKNACFVSAQVPLVRVPVVGSDHPEVVRRLFRDLERQSGSVGGALEGARTPLESRSKKRPLTVASAERAAAGRSADRLRRISCAISHPAKTVEAKKHET